MWKINKTTIFHGYKIIYFRNFELTKNTVSVIFHINLTNDPESFVVDLAIPDNKIV